MNSIFSVINYVLIFGSLYFEVFLLMSFFEQSDTDTDEKSRSGEFFPIVDIIVPIYNEEKTISKTLDSLLALNYPKDRYGIIVINDGSTDHSLDVAAKYSAEKNISIISKENGGKHTALNLGIQNSKAEFVGCLDADSFVDSNALKMIVQRFSDENIVAVTPSVHIASTDTFMRKTQKAEYQFGNFSRKVLEKIGAIHIAPGPFSFYRKSVFEKIGMYRKAHNTEDMEMAMRIQKHHMKIANEPRAIVYTTGPSSVQKLYKQRVRWVGGFLSNLIDYREMVFNKKYGDLGMLILPFAFLGILVEMFLFVKMIFSIGSNGWLAYQKIYFGGFFMPHFSFDWFYINTSAATILGIALTLTTIFTVWLGNKISTGKWKISYEVLYFLTVYIFISPFWISKAIYNTITSTESSWR